LSVQTKHWDGEGMTFICVANRSGAIEHSWSTASGSSLLRKLVAAKAVDESGDMVRKSSQQEADQFVDRLAAVTDWLGIQVEHYPAWTVAALERELALMNKLARPFRNRGDEKAAALLKQIDARSAH
jgi:hypothetical protein